MVFERPVNGSVIGGPKLVEKLNAQVALLGFVPLHRRRDVKVGSRPGDKPIPSHRRFFAN